MYIGVYVNIAYNVTADMTRGIATHAHVHAHLSHVIYYIFMYVYINVGMMAKNIKKQKEFIVELEADVESRKQEKNAKPFHFKVAPDSLQNVKESSRRKIP